MIEDFYTETFIKLKKSQTDDGLGSKVDTYSEIQGSDFPGSLNLMSSDNRNSDMRSAYYATHKMKCSPLVSLSRKLRLRCKGIDYEVVWFKNVFGNHQKVLLKELEQV